MRLPLLALVICLALPGPAFADDPKDPVTQAYKIEAAGLNMVENAGSPLSEPARSKLLSKRLITLLLRDEKYSDEVQGVGLLDWDPFINSQDGELKGLKIQTTAQTATGGAVEATFTSFGKKQSVLFDIVREGNAWKIDDVRPAGDKGKRESLVKILSGPHECGSETGKKCD